MNRIVHNSGGRAWIRLFVVIEPDLFNQRKGLFFKEIRFPYIRWDRNARRRASLDWWWGRWVHGRGWDYAFRCR